MIESSACLSEADRTEFASRAQAVMSQLDNGEFRGQREAYLAKQQAWYSAMTAVSECLAKHTTSVQSQCAEQQMELERAYREKMELEAKLNSMGNSSITQIVQNMAAIRAEYPSCQ
jgi:uncharacterized protein YukE